MLRHILADWEIKVQRIGLPVSIHSGVGHEGVETKKRGHLRRRTYNAQDANHL